MSGDTRSSSRDLNRSHPNRDRHRAYSNGFGHDYPDEFVHDYGYEYGYGDGDDRGDDRRRPAPDAGYRPPHHGYRDDYRSRQDYSRSPPRSELPYDDIPDDRESARYGRGRGGYDDYADRADASRSRHSPDDCPRRERSASPTRNAGPPSDTVILEGLPSDIQAEEVRESLQRHSDMTRYPTFDVRVPGGRGRRAFVQFERVGDAVDFLQDHYPKIPLDLGGVVDGDADGKSPVYIHFARSREEPEPRGGQGPNWTCPTCDYSNFPTRNRCKSCGGPQTDTSFYSYRNTLTGESDAADAPSQILVFYPLAPSVTEEVLASGATKLELVEKPSAPKNPGEAPKLKSTAPVGDTSGYGARPGSVHRVFLMRDRDTNESFKFGFAEFWTVDDALAAITKFKKFREFTMASAAVNVSTIHLGVFVPELREVSPAAETTSFHPLFNPAIRVKYWEPHVFPSQRLVTENPPEGAKSHTAGDDAAGDAKKSKKRKAEGNLGSSSVKKAVPMLGQMAAWQKKHDELHEGKPRPDQDSGPVKITLSSSNAASNSQGPIKISLSGTSTLGKNMSLETAAPAPPRSASPWAKSQNGTPDPTTKPSADEAAAPVSYVDHEKVCCLLCMMKYKTLDDLNTHERSRNHKTAMADEEKVKKAKERLAKRDERMQKAAAGGGEVEADARAQQQYRDRAKERREVYRQPNKPSSSSGQGGGAARKDQQKGSGADLPREASPPARQQQQQQPQQQQQQLSKGSTMLAKMGWTSGRGLGANGEGRTQVVETNAYQEGVGLGAEGGKLGDAAEVAQRRTQNSYTEYLSTVQEKARERYNRMN